MQSYRNLLQLKNDDGSCGNCDWDGSGDLSTIAIISMDQSYNQTLSIWNDLMLL